jgi:Domain of unknown function (DUF1707)
MDGLATRASDTDRERAVADLREHYAEGRLRADELERRASTAYAATHRGELAAVLADLPRVRRRTWSLEALLAHARRAHRLLLGGHLATFLGVNCFLVAVWLLTGRGIFWPALYLVPSAALLAWHWTATRPLARALSRPTTMVPGMTLLGHLVALSRKARG